MKYYVYNPLSNNNSTLKIMEEYSSQLKYDSTNKNKMAELKNILQPSDEIFIIGGDGSLNYLLNNYPFIFDYQLFYYKSGSANDYYLSLKDNNSYVYQISNENSFINSFGIGFDALVCLKTNNLTKKSKISYFIEAFKSIKSYQPIEINITYNNVEYTYKNVWLCSLQNGKYFGGGIKIAKDGAVDKEELDLCIAHGLNHISVFILLMFVKLGIAHIFSKYFFTIKTNQIHIKNNQKLLAQFDGDNYYLLDDIFISKSKKIKIKKITTFC